MAGGKRNCDSNIAERFQILHMVPRLASGLSFAVLTLSLFAITSWAGVGGSISGTIKDASGALVPNVDVTATNVGTGVQHQGATNGQGFYSFVDLPVGHYNITIQNPDSNPISVPASPWTPTAR